LALIKKKHLFYFKEYRFSCLRVKPKLLIPKAAIEPFWILGYGDLGLETCNLDVL